MVGLLTEKEARDKIISAITDERHWVMTFSENSQDFISHIEDTYYSGDANVDFEILLLGGHHGFLSIVIASRKHLNVTQIKQAMRKMWLSDDWEDNIGDFEAFIDSFDDYHTVLISPQDMDRAMMFNEWLMA